MSNRIGDLAATSSIAFSDLFEKEVAGFVASNGITAKDLRTGLFLGGTGFVANDPLVCGPITVNTNKFLVDINGNATVAGNMTVAGTLGVTLAATFTAAVTVGATLTASTLASTGISNIVIPTTGTNRAYWQFTNTNNTTFIGIEGAAGSEILAGSSAYATILANSVARSLHLGTNNVIRMTIRSTGEVDHTNDITVAATKQVFLDGGGDTSIRESAANTITFKAGGADTFAIIGTGVSSTGTITGTDIIAGAGNSHTWTGRSKISSAADGRISLTDNAGTSFTRLNLGPDASASFPALKRNGTDVEFRLGDDSAQTNILAANATASGFVKSVSASAGVGYGTGAGGTVTQGTNRNTAVTLNKICGQITTTSESANNGLFTVNNSTVAATDTVIVNLVSGPAAGTFVIVVNAVGAGSFRIFYNNAGGAGETNPFVINFSVIKAVTS